MSTRDTCFIREHDTPLGRLRLIASDRALVGLYFPEHVPAPKLGALEPHPRSNVLDRTQGQLDEYFAGRRVRFELPIEMRGTAFQRSVWAALTSIEVGTTRTYAAQAEAIGRPRAVRAVGTANGRNPISIVVPCHRVIASDGSLAGYAGGLERKRWLLEHERALRSCQSFD